MHSIKCPNCGRSAIEDDYYKTDERYIYCYRCGYLYTKLTDDGINYDIDDSKGYGTFYLVKKKGRGKRVLFNRPMTDDQFDEFKKEFFAENADQDQSYLITFEDGVFTCLLGTENFHLPFEEFKEKMIKKYGEDEFGLVPIEE